MGSGQEFLLTAQREDNKSNLLAKGEKRQDGVTQGRRMNSS